MLYYYCGTAEGNVRVSETVRRRLEMEAKDLLPQQRFVSKQIDEMGIKAALEFSRTRQKNTEQVDTGGLTGKEDESEGGTLVNSM